MSIFPIGAQIPLSAELFKNDQIKTGQTVKVSVFDIFGTELLSETDVPETAKPGQHTYVWTTGPSIPTTAKAYYTWVEQQKTVTEQLSIEMISKDGAFEKLTGTVLSKKLSGKIKEDSKLAGDIKSEKLAGNIKEDGTLKGKLKNIKLIGAIK
jgi:hypothetical protein